MFGEYKLHFSSSFMCVRVCQFVCNVHASCIFLKHQTKTNNTRDTGETTAVTAAAEIGKPKSSARFKAHIYSFLHLIVRLWVCTIHAAACARWYSTRNHGKKHDSTMPHRKDCHRQRRRQRRKSPRSSDYTILISSFALLRISRGTASHSFESITFFSIKYLHCMPLWLQLSIIHIATCCNRSLVNFIFFFFQRFETIFFILFLRSPARLLSCCMCVRYKSAQCCTYEAIAMPLVYDTWNDSAFVMLVCENQMRK